MRHLFLFGAIANFNSMEIIYRNALEKPITEQEALLLGEYTKSYSENGITLQRECFYDGAVTSLTFMNHTEEAHEAIMNRYSALYGIIDIVECDRFGDYRLETGYRYDPGFCGSSLALYNPDGELIAHGWKNADGAYEYDMTRKYYYDRAVNPDCELFECTFHEHTAQLLRLYWNNYHIDDDGQDSFVLLNTPEDIQQLIDLTGMPRPLAEYYMIAEIVPYGLG